MIGQRLNQYEIIDVIGQGGMAIVYRAREVASNREVAIKIIEKLKLDGRQDFVIRFQREV